MKACKHRALIVEDDDDIVGVIEDHLESLDHNYDRAASQAEARGKLATNKYCYILLDLEIPVKPKHIPDLTHGKNLLDEIRRRTENCRTQVIIMTCHGRNGPDLAVEMMQKGADDYICKPFGAAGGGRSLPDVIKKALQRGCSHAPARCPALARTPTGDEPGSPSARPAALTPFSGGKLTFHADHVELLGQTILTSKGNECSRRVLELLARKARGGGYRAYSGKDLAKELDPQRTVTPNDVAGYVKYLRGQCEAALKKHGISCGRHDVIESRGTGYRLNQGIAVEGLRS